MDIEAKIITEDGVEKLEIQPKIPLPIKYTKEKLKEDRKFAVNQRDFFQSRVDKLDEQLAMFK